MDEYIKRADAIAHPFANGKYDHKHANKDFINGHESYKEWLEGLPTADVRENVRGKWLHFARSDECSVCGYDTGKYEMGSKFCPNCGAEMEK